MATRYGMEEIQEFGNLKVGMDTAVGRISHMVRIVEPDPDYRYGQVLFTTGTKSRNGLPQVWHAQAYDLYFVRKPYPNGVQVIYQGFHGGNKEYTALNPQGEEVGEFLVDVYSYGEDTKGRIGSKRFGPRTFNGGYAEWVRDLKKLQREAVAA